MKRLIISEIVLLSNRDRKARRVKFDPKRTVLLGPNQTGKSSLVKSIYHALGAEPARMDQRWINAEVKSLIKFSIDDARYMLIRDYNYYSMFNGEGDFIKSFTHVTGGLGPFLANIFDFKLVLSSREQTAEVPPPAFQYLPFYVDQDASWQSTWSGFSRLFQYTGWKQTVAEYHCGVRDNYYYELLATYINTQRLLGQITQQAEALRAVIKRLSEEKVRATFDLNPNLFGEQVERLLEESKLLYDEEVKLKDRLSDLNGQRAIQQSRLIIATRALGEIGKDFNFLSSLPTEMIECPTCGSEYQNDFSARFAIAKDEDRVAVFIDQIRAELSKLDREIEGVYDKFKVAKTHARKIQGILTEKQGELSLEQIIESEGRKAADNLLSGQLVDLDIQRSTANDRHESAKASLEAHEEKLSGTEKEIMEQYARLFRRNLNELAVVPLSGDIYSNLSPYIRETGSSLPRSLLAYYFTVVEIAAQRSPATICPFVVDSPNQQAQDDVSLKIMLNFIAAHQPENIQMILAVEKTMGVELGGEVVILNDKYNLLNSDEYESARHEYTLLTKKSLS